MNLNEMRKLSDKISFAFHVELIDIKGLGFLISWDLLWSWEQFARNLHVMFYGNLL